jgi:hypothetical protein
MDGKQSVASSGTCPGRPLRANAVTLESGRDFEASNEISLVLLVNGLGRETGIALFWQSLDWPLSHSGQLAHVV